MSIISSQIIKNTTKEFVIKFTTSFTDTINENSTKIDASLIPGALNTNNTLLYAGGTKLPYYGLTIKHIWYNTSFTNNKYINLYWDGLTPQNIININNKYGEYNLEATLPVINNNAITPNGNIGLQTVNVANGDFYTIILELHKNNEHYHAGQFNDPGAFNYIIDTELMTENNNFIITETGFSINIPLIR